MNITAIGSRKGVPAGPINTVPSSETSSGQIVSLSGFSGNRREQFVAAVRKAEEAFASLPSVAMIRGDLAADVVLAHRLTAIARKATAMASRLAQKDPVSARERD